MLILAGPSLACFFSIGTSSLASIARQRGLELTDGSVRVGWITPLQLTDVRLTAPAGSTVQIEELRVPLTLMDLFRGRYSIPSQTPARLRGVQIDGTVDSRGQSSLATDLATVLAAGESGAEPMDLAVEVEDLAVRLSDGTGGPVWAIHQVAGSVVSQGNETTIELAALVDAPGHPGGSTSAAVTLRPAAGRVDVRCRTESLPLRIAELLPAQFRPARWPARFRGDATGGMELQIATGQPTGPGLVPGMVGQMEFQQLVLRDVSVDLPTDSTDANPTPTTWQLESATLDGTFRLDPARVVADRLTAASDFASLQFDGSIGRTVSLTGRDNPLAWLQTVDGQMTLDVNLAALSRALPGTLPVREGTRITTGDLAIRVQPAAAGGRFGDAAQRLTARISEIVATGPGGGRSAVPPAEAVAVLRLVNDELVADQFSVDSPYLTANGRGSIGSGDVGVRADLGRLVAALQPIFDIPGDRFDGRIAGDVRWQTDPSGRWQLDGTGTADDLRLAVSADQRIQTQRLRAKISSLGERRGGSLWLQRGSAELTGDDLTATIQLTRPADVLDPGAIKPVQIQAGGSLLAAAQLARPWWPAAAQPMAGRFDLDARGDWLPGGSVRVDQSSLKLTGSAWAVAGRTVAQNRIEADFGGLVDFSRGLFEIEAANMVGEMASAGLHGRISPSDTDLEIAWRVDLERMGSAISSPGAVAGAPAVTIQPVSTGTGRRPAAESSIVATGIVDGRTEVRSVAGNLVAGELVLRHELSASDVAVVERSGGPRGGSSTSGAPFGPNRTFASAA